MDQKQSPGTTTIIRKMKIVSQKMLVGQGLASLCFPPLAQCQEDRLGSTIHRMSLVLRRPAQPGFHLGQSGDHLIAGRTVGDDFIDLGHDLPGGEIVLYQFRDDLLSGNEVDHGKVRNLNPGTPQQVAEATRRCVLAGGGQRHIVNLSHGVDRATPVANFEAYVRAVRGGS